MNATWIPIASIVVGGLVRLSKTDVWVKWFPVNLQPKIRPWAALVLGAASAAIGHLTGGGTWPEAIAGGLMAGLGAIAGHELIVESVRGGRDLGVPKEPPMFPTKEG